MVKFLGKLAAVPVRVLAGIVGLVRRFDPLPLWRASWNLSREPQDGCNVLVFWFKKRGIESVREMAKEMMFQVKDSALAATMGWLEIQHSRDFEAANKWVDMARDLQATRQETLLHLELFLSSRDSDKSNEVVERILARNDLPMGFTQAALVSKAWGLAEQQQWLEAEGIANRILSIEEQIDARLVKWMVLTARGKSGADEQLRKARGRVPDAVVNMLLAQCYLFLGDVRRAMEWLYKAEEERPWVGTLGSRVGELARSEEFQSYYSQRKNR